MDPYPVTARTRLKRRPTRGRYDRRTVNAFLDAGLICHVGLVIDGEPLVVPTVYWRDGERIVWHGSKDSRMAQAARQGAHVCVTVTRLDGVVAARAAFYHSVLYRSVRPSGFRWWSRTRPGSGRRCGA